MGKYDDYDETDYSITGTNNNLNNTEIVKVEKTVGEQLEELEEIINRMDNCIFDMWKNVIMPYKEDYMNNDVLDKLNGYDVFYNFFIENNEVYKEYQQKLFNLRKKNNL